jgi:hypothetical protein
MLPEDSTVTIYLGQYLDGSRYQKTERRPKRLKGQNENVIKVCTRLL